MAGAGTTGPDARLHEAVLDACTRPGVVRTHFQPIVDLARGIVTGYEALSRFDGLVDVPPDRWFAAAHAAGLGEQLEARALRNALSARVALPDNCFLTVNLGPRALLSPDVGAVLDAEGDLRGVVVEVTEQQPVDDYVALRAVLGPLRERGALLAVDDAGAGFSSLQHITALRPDLVKVDRALVAGMDRDETKQAVIETLGIFASRLDAWLLAEGVETTAELERLVTLRVPLAQGFGLGRPSAAMTTLDPRAAEVCHRRSALAELGGELLALVEAVPTILAGAAEAELADVLHRHPGAGHVVVVDEFHRPVALIGRGATLGRADRPAPLSVTATERLTDIVRRAVTRPPDEQLLPVAVCDDQHRLLGLVPVERLLGRLADRADAGPGPPRGDAAVAG